MCIVDVSGWGSVEVGSPGSHLLGNSKGFASVHGKGPKGLLILQSWAGITNLPYTGQVAFAISLCVKWNQQE